MFVITLILCLTQMIRIFKNTKQLISYQMGVLLMASIESFLGLLHWGFFPPTAFNYWIIYLKELQLVVITYFFILSALIAFQVRHLEKKFVQNSDFICIVILVMLTLLFFFDF